MSTHPHTRNPPALTAIAAEQLDFLTAAFARQLLMFSAFGGLAALPIVLLGKFQFGHGAATAILVLLSIWGASSAWVQRGKAPQSARAYFGSVPVRGSSHVLIRTMIGWAMLMVIGAGLLAFAHVRVAGGGIPFRGWVAPLIGTTTIYLVLSGLYAGTRQPLIWLMGLFWLPALASRLTTLGTERFVDVLAEGRFGLAALFMAAVVREEPGGAETMIPVDGQTWLLASCLWLAGGLAVLLCATARHRDA